MAQKLPVAVAHSTQMVDKLSNYFLSFLLSFPNLPFFPPTRAQATWPLATTLLEHLAFTTVGIFFFFKCSIQHEHAFEIIFCQAQAHDEHSKNALTWSFSLMNLRHTKRYCENPHINNNTKFQSLFPPFKVSRGFYAILAKHVKRIQAVSCDEVSFIISLELQKKLKIKNTKHFPPTLRHTWTSQAKFT